GRCPICVVGLFLLFGGGVAIAPTGSPNDATQVQTAKNMQKDVLVATATGGAGGARSTVTTVVGAATKNAGNANKAQAVQKGAQKTTQSKTSSKYENTTNK